MLTRRAFRSEAPPTVRRRPGAPRGEVREDAAVSNGGTNPWMPAGNVGQPAPSAPGPSPTVGPSPGIGPSSIAAIGIVVAVALVLIGALVSGLSMEERGDAGWQVTVKLIGLGGASYFGLASSGALVVGVALLVAYSLTDATGAAARGVGVGILVTGGYLLVVTLLNLYVDVDALSGAGDDAGLIVGTLISDLGSVVALATAAWSGARLLSTR